MKLITTVLNTHIMTEFSLFLRLKTKTRISRRVWIDRRWGQTCFTIAVLEQNKKKKKMSEKITKKKMSNQSCFNHKNFPDDQDPQRISVQCEKKKSTKKVIFHTSDIGGRVEIGLPYITS